jgi:hypothetical protein
MDDDRTAGRGTANAKTQGRIHFGIFEELKEDLEGWNPAP